MKRRFIGVALIGLSLFAMMLTFAFRKGAKDSEEAELATTLRVAVAADAAAEYDQMLFEEFMKQYPDIKIETVSFPAPVYSANLEALMSGQQPVDEIGRAHV